MCLGVPGRILDIRSVDGLQMAEVDFGGARREVCLAYVPEAQVGDYVVVHVGFAISRISEEEAMETRALLSEIEAAGEASRELPARGGVEGDA